MDDFKAAIGFSKNFSNKLVIIVMNDSLHQGNLEQADF